MAGGYVMWGHYATYWFRDPLPGIQRSSTPKHLRVLHDVVTTLPYQQMDPANEFYYGRVLAVDSLDLNGIADEIVGMGTTVTKTDVLAVLESMCESVERNLLKGVRVSLGGVVEICYALGGRALADVRG